MGRPSKLSDPQWAEVIRRKIAGEKGSDLARDYNVDPAQITRRVTQHAKLIESVAHQVADAETAFENLPVSQQACARTLADQLKGIQANYARSAAAGAEVSAILQERSLGMARNLPKDVYPDDLRPIAALADTAARSLQPATALITAKVHPAQQESNAVDLRRLSDAELRARAKALLEGA